MSTKILRFVVGALRAGLVFALVVLCLVGANLRNARAAWGERLQGFGDELARWESFRLASAARRLSLNGVELELVSASTTLSVSEALDRLEVVCRTRGGVVGKEMAHRLLATPVESGSDRLAPRIRREEDSKGVLACLDTGRELSFSELSARLSTFAKTGDLNRVGALRYAVAVRHQNRTSVLFIWSDGPMPLVGMFPKLGDAPGVDPEGVPRPGGTRRLLSGIEHGAPYSFSAYSVSERSPGQVLDWYRKSLVTAGFGVADAAPGSVLARKGERMLVITAARGLVGVVAAVSELR